MDRQIGITAVVSVVHLATRTKTDFRGRRAASCVTQANQQQLMLESITLTTDDTLSFPTSSLRAHNLSAFEAGVTLHATNQPSEMFSGAAKWHLGGARCVVAIGVINSAPRATGYYLLIFCSLASGTGHLHSLILVSVLLMEKHPP